MKSAYFMAGIIVTGLALTATSSLAFGRGETGPGQRMSFQELDSNGDGQITSDEMQTRAAARFAGADSDGDGLLSAAEIQARGQKRLAGRVAAMIARFDNDGDGALSPEELPGPGRAGKMFGKFDLDQSGGISEQEFEEARAAMISRWGKYGSGSWNKN